MRTALGYARDGARVGQAAGDLGMACYARNHIASDMLVIGDPLDRIPHGARRQHLHDARCRLSDIELILTAQINLVDTLIHGDALSEIAQGISKTRPWRRGFWARHYAGLQMFFAGDIEAARRHLARPRS